MANELVLKSPDLYASTSLDKLAELINRGHEEILVHVRRTALEVAQVGAWAVAAKGKCVHGEWEKWVKSKCPSVGLTTMWKYASIYRRVEKGNLHLSEDMLPTAAYKMLGIVKSDAAEQKTEKRKEETDEAIRGVVKAKFKDVCDIRNCGFDELLSDCKADIIITDPPYPKEFVPLYGKFAKAAKESGIPIVAVMCGQSYFPTILADMCKHLEYRWLLCYLTPGGTLQQWGAQAMCGWKPVVLFGGKKWVYDVFKSKKDDKRFHHWGQSLSGLSDLVDRLSEPNQTVCDPFCGGGSTAIASLLLGRKFIGCDIDEKAVESSTARAREICNG
jgi:hypothetical protein